MQIKSNSEHDKSIETTISMLFFYAKNQKERYKMNENKKQLCPNCKTGADALKLDPHEPMCPYMELHNGQTCTKYVPIEKDNG